MKGPEVTKQFRHIMPINLFVYGTLKHGFHNHRWCAQALDIRPAWTWGRLYDLRAGFPALEVPDTLILAAGTDNPWDDAWEPLERRWQLRMMMRDLELTPEGDWDRIAGELVTLADACRDLPTIDRLEGFQANGRHNLYDRVLVPVWTATASGVAWTYDGAKLRAEGIRCGFWPVNPRFSGARQ